MELNGKKIIITCGGGLGDMLTFTPALRRLKAKWPDCNLVFLTKYGAHEVLARLEYIDKLTYIRRGTLLGRYRVLPDIWGADAIVFTEWQPQILAVSKLINIPLRAGISRENHRLNDYLTYHIKHRVMGESAYAAVTHANMISESLGIELDGDMSELDISKPNQEEVDGANRLLNNIGINPQEPYVLLSPYTSYYKRDWPEKEIEKLIRMIDQKIGIPVILLGDKSLSQTPIAKYNLIGKTKVMEMVELIRRAKCIVTTDSGPMHVAAALGRSCVALFSKDLPSRWAPRHNCRVVYLKKSCSPCNDEALHACNNPECIKDISADTVFREVECFL